MVTWACNKYSGVKTIGLCWCSGGRQIGLRKDMTWHHLRRNQPPDMVHYVKADGKEQTPELYEKCAAEFARTKHTPHVMKTSYYSTSQTTPFRIRMWYRKRRGDEKVDKLQLLEPGRNVDTSRRENRTGSKPISRGSPPAKGISPKTVRRSGTEGLKRADRTADTSM